MKPASALLLVALSLLAGNAPGQTPPRASVQATGNGSVSVTPDQATINVSVVTSAVAAQDAASQNASIATTVIGQITQVLGTSGTVQTVNYSVVPNYKYPTNATPVLTGYTVTNTILVTLNDLTITGKVIDTATQAGASQITSLQFGLKDDTVARGQALNAAVLKAKSKADAMAASLGLHTGTVLVIQESGAVVRQLTGIGAPTGVATPVQTGQLTVTANVTISVELVN